MKMRASESAVRRALVEAIEALGAIGEENNTLTETLTKTRLEARRALRQVEEICMQSAAPIAGEVAH